MKTQTSAALLVSALLAACGGGGDSASPPQPVATAAPAFVEIETAELQREGEQLSLSWSIEGAGAPVDVYLASSPDAASKRTLISDDDADGRHVFSAPALPRPYVYLQPAAGGEGLWVAERLLPLEGGHNFRDLGGYETADDSHVRWGTLFRSGTMAGLTDEDYAYLQTLGIEVICDLRTSEERQREPTDWQRMNPDLEYLSWDYSMSDGGGSLFEVLGENPSPARVQELFEGFYRDLPDRFAPRYAAMFEKLVHGEAPLAVNCSAGKDRTGGASALLLTALGVPRAQVVADYALSEKLVDFGSEAREKAAENPSYALMLKWDPESLRVLTGSDPSLIRAMFAAIEANYGSVENYFEQKLDVDAADLAALRRQYLVRSGTELVQR